MNTLLDPPRKHGLHAHPATWPGSCFLDFAGARLLPGFDTSALWAELPRLRLGQLFRHVGLKPKPLTPASDEALRELGVARLRVLTASVYAIPSALDRPCRLVTDAHALAIQSALRAGFPPGAVKPFFTASPRTLRRLAKRALPDAALRALRLRAALNAEIARA